MTSTVKIDFSKLIGCEYPIEIKMEVLNWMLKTGKGYDHKYGWSRDGINKSLLAYCANNRDVPARLPNYNDLNMFFDAVFARAVFSPANKPLNEWREKENIKPYKYRMLKFNNKMPEYPIILIRNIYELKGKIIKKEYHHPDYPDRTEPKIIRISIFTIGNGWEVGYEFSFKEFNYDPWWYKNFRQSENESVCEFLDRIYRELCDLLAE